MGQIKFLCFGEHRLGGTIKTTPMLKSPFGTHFTDDAKRKKLRGN